MPTIYFGTNATPVNVANPDETSLLLTDTDIISNDSTPNEAGTNIGFATPTSRAVVLKPEDLLTRVGGSTVLSATLYMRQNYWQPAGKTSVTDRTVWMARITKPIVMTEATWTEYSAGLTWESLGAQGATDKADETSIVVTTDTSDPVNPNWPWIEFDVTSVVQAIVTSGVNNGFFMWRDAAAAGGFVFFDSAENASTSVRPELVVVTGAPPATVTLDQATLVPGTTVSGTYSNFQVVPTSPLVLTDSSGNTINVTVSISDNGDGTGTFTGSMPTLPAAGNTSDNLLFGTVTASLD